MLTFPQLLEADRQRFEAALGDLIRKSDALAALIVEKAGYLIHQGGETGRYDTTQLATLAANAFNATEFMAGLIGEPDFASLYQEGDRTSSLILNVDHRALLVVIFPATVKVGVVKYYAAQTVQQLTEQIRLAETRAPGAGLDPALLDVTDSEAFFKKRDP